MKTVQILSMLTILMLVSSCGNGTLFPTSDVPCFSPFEWANSSATLFIRSENGNPDVLLFMHQSFEQRDIDRLDGRTEYKPHDPIYRFDRITNSFDIVDDAVWDNDTSAITDCISFGTRESTFSIMSEPNNFPQFILLYNEQQVSVAGGTYLKMFPAPFSDEIIVPAVAVLSTDGVRFRDFFFIPSSRSSGQHFHQLFSEVDGQPLGPPLRVGVSGIGEICWTLDKRYVIYAGSVPGDNEIYNKICVVDVEDEIQSVTGN